MTRAITFIIGCFIFVSLSGQVDKSNIWTNHKNLYLSNKLNNLESKIDEKHEQQLLTNSELSKWIVSKFISDQTTGRHLDSVIVEDIDESGQFIISERIEFKYDSNGNITLCANYKWDISANDWVGYWNRNTSAYVQGSNILYAAN